jgi:hypothetical protein
MESKILAFGVNVTPSYQLGITRLQIYIPPAKMSASLNVRLVDLLESNGYYIDSAYSDGMTASKQTTVDEFATMYKKFEKPGS